MTEIKTDILATLRTQEAALLAVLDTVRQTPPPEAWPLDSGAASWRLDSRPAARFTSLPTAEIPKKHCFCALICDCSHVFSTWVC